MTATLNIAFAKPGRKPTGTVVIFAGPGLALGPQAKALGVETLARQGGGDGGFQS